MRISRSRCAAAVVAAAVLSTALGALPASASQPPSPSVVSPLATPLALATAETPAETQERYRLRSLMYSLLHEVYDNQRIAKTSYTALPLEFRRRFYNLSVVTSQRITTLSRELGSATTLEQHRALYVRVLREVRCSRALIVSAKLAGDLLLARSTAIAAGQAATRQWLAGSIGDSEYERLADAAGAVAAWAEADRKRLDSTLGSDRAPAPSTALAWMSALDGSRPVPVPTGWQPIPGACALPVSDAGWLGSAGPGPQQWVSAAEVSAARARARAGTDERFTTADTTMSRLGRRLMVLPTASVGELRVRAQRLGYLWMVHGDAAARTRLLTDVESYALAGPSRRDLTDVSTLQAIVTSIDWLALPPTREHRLITAVRSLWLAPFTCRLNDRIGPELPTNVAVVYNSALFQAGILVGEDDRPAGAAIARSAWRNLAQTFPAFDDGGWYEGPSYWNFQSYWLVGALSTAANVYGGAYPSRIPDAALAASFAWNATSRSGAIPSFGDADGQPLRTTLASLSLRGGAYLPAAMAQLRTRLLTGNRDAFELLWWPSAANWSAPDPARASATYGTTGLAVLHASTATAWLKGSPAGLSHTHLDVGSLGLFARGVSWAVDPGSGDYGSPRYFETTSTSPRWSYWAVSPEAHTALSGSAQPVVGARAPLFLSGASAAVDLGATLPGVTSATRLVTLGSGRMTATDTVVSPGEQPWTWRWVTEAAVTTGGTDEAPTFALAQDGQRLTLALTGLPAGSTARVEEAPRLSARGRTMRVITVTTPPVTELTLVTSATW